MRKGTIKLKTGGLLLAVAAALLVAAGAISVNARTDKSVKSGADLIMIDTLKAMGPLERPPVVFFHSRHTEALAKNGGDCSACHLTDAKGRLSPKFKRLQESDRQAVADIYHLNCIACHNEQAAAKQKSGPITCAGCHPQNPAVASTRAPIAFDKSLHYRHVKATDEKCESCHHVWDKQAKKLVYAKGEESACIYCHTDTAVENTPARKEAGHDQCISCHRTRQAQKAKAGPIDCLGCHDADHQLGIEVLESVPRMKRNQPDTVLVKTGAETLPDQPGAPVMNPVAFDHKAHEASSNSCKVCHHASLQSCASCHTNAGTKEGGGVKLAQAMHSVKDSASCIGCHLEQMKTPQCAGCHDFITKPANRQDSSCAACHTTSLPVGVNRADAQATAAVAAEQIAKRDRTTKLYPADQIPETVTIGKLADRFEPAIFPHGKIVRALADGTRSSNLAGYFHSDPGTLCQGCHHNSPPAQKPPACGSCHGETIEVADVFRPGLVGAYHQQCIGCHTAMGIAKPDSRDCNACHVEKTKG